MEMLKEFAKEFMSDAVHEEAKKFRRLKPVNVEIEGDRWNWCYVCGDCHGVVVCEQKECPHCGRKLLWK